MNLRTLTHHSRILIQAPKLNPNIIATNHSSCNGVKNVPFALRLHNRRNGSVTTCFIPGQELVAEEKPEILGENSIGGGGVEEVVVESTREEFSAEESIWSQITEIVRFSGPAVGLWLCGPLMSLIDTAVIGQESSIELAALGPGTVFCDNTSYVFMFLSIATSNFVATAIARRDKKHVQHQISILLFIGLVGGVLMLIFTRWFGPMGLTAFAGAKNKEIIAAANTYIQIRGLAWPAILVGWVAHSASLGMKDSWGPLKALAFASIINGIGDIILCRFYKYGIAGAAWATMVSQVVAAFMMIESLNKKGYNGFAISIPSSDELMNVFMLAAPVFVTMMSKVMFYSLLVYFATSMGTRIVAAHQVLIQLYCLCAVWGEPLSQTAQSFMPEFLYGVNRSLPKARSLLKSLLIIGAVNGLLLGCIGTSIPWLIPRTFTSDPEVIQEMHKVLAPFAVALFATPITHCLEGTLLAGRDLKFLSFSMTSIFLLGSLIVLLLTNRGWGILGCWVPLAAFHCSRLSVAFRRLTLPTGLLYSEDVTRYELGKLSTA